MEGSKMYYHFDQSAVLAETLIYFVPHEKNNASYYPFYYITIVGHIKVSTKYDFHVIWVNELNQNRQAGCYYLFHT